MAGPSVRKRHITFTMMPDRIDAIDAIADNERRSRSQMIRMLIDEAMTARARATTTRAAK